MWYYPEKLIKLTKIIKLLNMILHLKYPHEKYICDTLIIFIYKNDIG
jgi:hypothetical protein